VKFLRCRPRCIRIDTKLNYLSIFASLFDIQIRTKSSGAVLLNDCSSPTDFPHGDEHFNPNGSY
jgi:hypothetical protein